MALTTQEQTAIRTIINREGSLDAVVDQVRALHIQDRQAAALAALASVVTFAVSDWPALLANVQAASNIVLPKTLDDIEAAVAARDAAKLGPLLVALAGAVRAHYR